MRWNMFLGRIVLSRDPLDTQMSMLVRWATAIMKAKNKSGWASYEMYWRSVLSQARFFRWSGNKFEKEVLEAYLTELREHVCCVPSVALPDKGNQS